MTQEPIIVDSEDARLQGMPAEELKREFVRHLGIAADSIRAAAKCVRIADERGIEITADRSISQYYLNIVRKVAYNQLLPEIVSRVVDHSTFEKVAALPLPDQQKIADGTPLKVATGVTDAGEVDHVLVTLDEMTPEQKRQVFGKGCIRSPEQQWQIVSTKKPEKPLKIEATLTPQQHAKFLKETNRRRMTISEAIVAALEASGMV
jgi:hypothetical protein